MAELHFPTIGAELTVPFSRNTQIPSEPRLKTLSRVSTTAIELWDRVGFRPTAESGLRSGPSVLRDVVSLHGPGADAA